MADEAHKVNQIALSIVSYLENVLDNATSINEREEILTHIEKAILAQPQNFSTLVQAAAFPLRKILRDFHCDLLSRKQFYTNVGNHFCGGEFNYVDPEKEISAPTISKLSGSNPAIVPHGALSLSPALHKRVFRPSELGFKFLQVVSLDELRTLKKDLNAFVNSGILQKSFDENPFDSEIWKKIETFVSGFFLMKETKTKWL